MDTLSSQQLFKILNPNRDRQIKLNYYYKNRARSYLFIDKPTTKEESREAREYNAKLRSRKKYLGKQFKRLITEWKVSFE